MGLPYFRMPEDAPHEAEALGATLVNAGVAATVVTEDSDVLVYGASMLRNPFGRHSAPLEINGTDVRSGLNLTQPQFVDLALLCGTDFSDRVPRYVCSVLIKFLANRIL